MSELEEELVLVVAGSKDELAVIASSDDVIKAALDFKSWLAHSAASSNKPEEEIANCTPDPHDSDSCDS